MKKNWYLFWFLCCCFGSISGQSNVVFTHLSIFDGLSQATVNTILQDKNDIIWLGTRDGLNRYDGYSFETYKYNLRNQKSISNNNIKIVYEDKVGDLWIGTDNGLNRFNRSTQDFERFFADSGNRNTLSDNNIRAIAEDAAGNLWIATSEGGLCKVVFSGTESQRKINRFITFKPNSNKPNSILNASIRALFLDETGNFWIGTDTGLNLLMSNNGQFSFKAIIAPDFDFSSTSVNSITDDRRGNLWLGTWGDGLIKMSNTKSQRTFKHFLPNKSPNSLKEAYIIALQHDEAGNVWVGTWTNGLQKIEQDQRDETIFTHYQHDPLNPKSICHNSIRSIYQDKFGVLWVGTYGDGISKIDPNVTKFEHYYRDIHNPKGLQGEDIYAITEDNYGGLWIGSWIGGLHRTRDIVSGEYDHFNTSRFSNFANEKITNFLLDSKGRFWVGTWGKGVYKVNFTKNGDVTGFESIDIYTETDVLFNGYRNIRQVYEDKNGTIWLATNKGVYYLNGNQFEYVNFYNNKKNPESIGNDDIHTLFEDSKGNLWIGSGWNGLAYIPIKDIDLKSKEAIFVNVFRHKRSNLLSISSDNITTIYEDNKQQLWIGTDGGINLFDYKNKTFTHFTEAEGLPNSTINAILEDESGHLWISTNKGISKFDTDKRSFENYDVRDGLQSNEFVRMAAYKTHLGWMYFGGINGLNHFHPAKIKSNQRPPAVVFTDFKISNQSVDPKTNTSIISKPIQFVDEIHLSYKDKVISFEFSALNYTNPERNQYQYLLVGFNKVWQQIGNQRSVTFTNLNPGTYTLKVKGANSDGVWNETPIEIKIIIAPPFWATWWFKILVLLLIAVAVLAFIRFRLKQIQRENEKLEILVQERTEKIQRQKELIEERSKFKEQFFSNVSHELRTPLNGILGISHLLAKTELNSTQRQFTDAIKISADNLLIIINDLLDVSKLSAGQLELIQKPFDTLKLISTLYELFRPRTEEKGLKLMFEIDNSIPQYLKGDQVRFYQILINLLGNALKFTAQGYIKMKISPEEKGGKCSLSIAVEDTGIGIPLEKIDKIFGNYTQIIDASGYHYEGSGLGLTIVKDLIGLHNGEINVSSILNEGTIFNVNLPFVIPSETEIDEFLQQELNQIFKQKWEGKKVLLIEDNEVNQLYARNLFIDWQLNADFAETVKEAQDKSASMTYDCILADVKLPDGDGLKFVRSVRKNQYHPNKQTPVIVLTAGTSPEEKLRAQGLDVFAYITKPFDPDSLMRALNLVFNQNKTSKKEEDDEIDYDYLANLGKLVKFNKSHLVKIIDTYLGQVPNFEKNITKAIQDRDYESLYFETHTILSSLRTIGISELVEIVSSLNNAARQLTSFEIIEEINEDFERMHKIHLVKLRKESKKIKSEIQRLSSSITA
jgi:signal transduction histidine kinase/ligand-binding sensor domain-containing protein/CheY-like chemotaxis protein/HPt (histidine-containing phosphotransfer) domain-containing protein